MKWLRRKSHLPAITNRGFVCTLVGRLIPDFQDTFSSIRGVNALQRFLSVIVF